MKNIFKDMSKETIKQNAIIIILIIITSMIGLTVKDENVLMMCFFPFGLLICGLVMLNSKNNNLEEVFLNKYGKLIIIIAILAQNIKGYMYLSIPDVLWVQRLYNFIRISYNLLIISASVLQIVERIKEINKDNSNKKQQIKKYVVYVEEVS